MAKVVGKDLETTAKHKPNTANRSCAQNAVVIAAATLTGHGHRRLAAISMHCSNPLAMWQGTSSKECRSMDESKAWLKGQLKGGFVDFCQVTLAILIDESIITDCGFVVPACDGNADVVSDDRFAQNMVPLCLELVGCRIMRILNVVRGWPQHLLVMLVNNERGRTAMQLFRRDQ